MTTYNTGNPVPSADPRDRYDNSQAFDEAVTGQELTFTDRLGVERKSWAGLEQQVADSLEKLGWEAVTIPYATDAVVQRPTQLVERNGELYRVSLQSLLPLTLSGTWSTDAPKLVAVGNQALRDLLASGSGASMIGRGSSTVAADLSAVEQRLSEISASAESPASFGATGDGVTNDTAAFEALEAVLSGQIVDLEGLRYLVNAEPKANRYYNGSLKIAGYSRNAGLTGSIAPKVPVWTRYGGQLASLKDDLANPLVQIVGVVMIGDSITWGTGTAESATAEPRDGTLSDARDIFATGSYVNNLKRYIGQFYAGGAAPALSNWPASPSGESTAEYTKQNIIFPGVSDFVATVAGSAAVTQTEVSGSLTGRRLTISVPSSTSNSANIVFKFTGDRFTIAYGQVSAGATYELLINGVSQGTFSTSGGAQSNVQREHTFSFVRNADVTLRIVGDGVAIKSMYWEGLIVNKKIRITNQGINGTIANRYLSYNINGASFGDGVAVGAQDGYTFIQLGTNDRSARYDLFAGGALSFRDQLEALVNALPATTKPILMVANPATETTGTRTFTMLDAKNAIGQLAKKKGIDFIDNYTVFDGINLLSVTNGDELHPNVLGHAIISTNISRAIEQAW